MRRRRHPGAIVTYPRWGAAEGSKHTEELSAGLGRGTNQLGELWAIGMVLGVEDLATKALAGYDPPAHGTISLIASTPKAASGKAGTQRGLTRPSSRGSAPSWRPAPEAGPSIGSPDTQA